MESKNTRFYNSTHPITRQAAVLIVWPSPNGDPFGTGDVGSRIADEGGGVSVSRGGSDMLWDGDSTVYDTAKLRGKLIAGLRQVCRIRLKLRGIVR